MTIARTLPVSLAPRFSRAPRVVVRSDSASFEAVVAERFGLRLRGLAGLKAGDLVPLVFPRCRSLHTFGMRAAIDVAWLELGEEGEGEVLAVDEAAGPRRLVRAPAGASRQRTAALELRATDATALGLRPGTNVTLRFDAEGWAPDAAAR
jgi:uncharacterized membrane protein (UPF0127 family)